MKQALADLLTHLEQTVVPCGRLGTGLTDEEVDAARAAVAQDMGR